MPRLQDPVVTRTGASSHGCTTASRTDEPPLVPVISQVLEGIPQEHASETRGFAIPGPPAGDTRYGSTRSR